MVLSSENMHPAIKPGNCYIETIDLHKPLAELAMETNTDGECIHPTDNEFYRLVAGELRCIGEDLLNEMHDKMHEKFYQQDRTLPEHITNQLWCMGLDGILAWDDNLIDSEIEEMEMRMFSMQQLLHKALEIYLAALLPQGRLTSPPPLREFLRCFFKSLTEWRFFRKVNCINVDIRKRDEQFTEVIRRTMYRCLKGRIELINKPAEQPSGAFPPSSRGFTTTRPTEDDYHQRQQYAYSELPVSEEHELLQAQSSWSPVSDASRKSAHARGIKDTGSPGSRRSKKGARVKDIQSPISATRVKDIRSPSSAASNKNGTAKGVKEVQLSSRYRSGNPQLEPSIVETDTTVSTRTSSSRHSYRSHSKPRSEQTSQTQRRSDSSESNTRPVILFKSLADISPDDSVSNIGGPTVDVVVNVPQRPSSPLTTDVMASKSSTTSETLTADALARFISDSENAYRPDDDASETSV